MTTEAPPRAPAAFAQLRARLGWTQTQLGAWFGVTELTMNRWEGGHTAPPALTLRIAVLIASVDDPHSLLRMLGPR